MKEGHGIGILVGAAVAVAAGIGIHKLQGSTAKEAKSTGDEIFEKLILGQAVFDVVDGAVLWDWFTKQQEQADEALLFLVAKPEKKTYEMLALPDPPKAFDPSHYLIQAAIDEKKKIPPFSMRLVSYGKIADKLEKQFGSDGYLIVKGE